MTAIAFIAEATTIMGCNSGVEILTGFPPKLIDLFNGPADALLSEVTASGDTIIFRVTFAASSEAAARAAAVEKSVAAAAKSATIFDESAGLNFHDAVVYETDVKLLVNPDWLNDACINFIFRWFEHETFKGSTDLLFLDPCVVSCLMIQCDDEEEVLELAEGLDLSSRRYTFIPVNNSLSFDTMGRHWSLLVCDHGASGADTFKHYDSAGGMNEAAATATAEKFWTMLQQQGACPAVEAGETPQQQNGYDCGMHTVMTAEIIAAAGATARAEPPALAAGLSPPRVSARRVEFAECIRKLRMV
jgi:sentrin-specific protease 8